MPPAEQLASRILLGPALRLQPDRRLVTLVRDGYEGAFEEIVRRYRRPLDRFAAAIVGARSEDVTQDAFSKALLALRGSEAEIELRPWLYRIVRNTALNDLRDSPPPTEELAESLSGGESAAATAERHEELAELMRRLRALPEPQRAAIVMRELEGLSHEEIAAALGVSGGAARQAIYRARAALRDGLGLLLPLPLVRALLDHAADAAGGAAVAAAGRLGDRRGAGRDRRRRRAEDRRGDDARRRRRRRRHRRQARRQPPARAGHGGEPPGRPRHDDRPGGARAGPRRRQGVEPLRGRRARGGPERRPGRPRRAQEQLARRELGR